MTLHKLVQTLTPLFKDSFDQSETMLWLSNDKNMFWSWGVSKKIAIADKALLLKVNAHKHKGYVLITLGYDDTFEVSFVKTNGKVVSTHPGIYCDDIQEFIDEKIERIPAYVR